MANFNSNVHSMHEVRQALQRIDQQLITINNIIIEDDGNGNDGCDCGSGRVRVWTRKIDFKAYTSGWDPDDLPHVEYIEDIHRIAGPYSHLDLWLVNLELTGSSGQGRWFLQGSERFDGWHNLNPLSEEPPYYDTINPAEWSPSGGAPVPRGLYEWHAGFLTEGVNVISADRSMGDLAGYPINTAAGDTLRLRGEFSGWTTAICFEWWLIGRYVRHDVVHWDKPCEPV